MRFRHGFKRSFLGVAALCLALPLVAVTAPPSGATTAPEKNVTNDSTHRFGEPELAVNPTNPNNLVYAIVAHKETYKCEHSADTNCTTFSRGQPLGFFATPGWYFLKVYNTFNRGVTWTDVTPTDLIPAFRGFPLEFANHSDLKTQSDPMVTVTADGTFYLGWDSMHMGAGVPILGTTLVDGGIAVSKSTNGGATWSKSVLTGTGVDRPWMTADVSDGTVYEASSGSVDGSMSTGDASAPLFGNGVSDRYVTSSPDGLAWTTPQQLGTGAFPGSSGATISAAQGVLTAGFRATQTSACMSSSVPPDHARSSRRRQTPASTWTRHKVPAPATSTGSVMVAADPALASTYTVVVLNSTSTALMSYVTHNSGTTWTGPTTLTDSTKTLKFKSWINYSPDGVLGLMWRSHTGKSLKSKYKVFAAISGTQGSTWSAPYLVGAKPSPKSDPKFSAGGLDDTSFIALSSQAAPSSPTSCLRRSAFVAWGDWRPKEVQGYFRNLDLTVFGNHCGQ